MVVSPRVTAGPYVVGEKPAPLVYSFLDANGVAINLAGYTVTFTYRRGDDSVAVTGSASVTGAATGQVTATWGTAPFPEPGRYYAEFWVDNSVNRFASVLITFVVRAAVDSTATFEP